MKKILAVLLLAVFVGPLFADDALVLPEGVWRFRVIPSGSFISSEFDDSGSREDLTSADSIQSYNLSGALEYGINPWINAAVQWTPGWNFSTNFEGADNEITGYGLNDLFLGAKLQILGEEAPVASDAMRFAFATGLIVPLSTYDASEEAENAVLGDEFRARTDEDAFAAGYRLYFDYIFTEQFFVNLYNELIYYFPTNQVNFTSATNYWGTYYGQISAGQSVAAATAAAEAAGSIDELEVEPGLDLTFEIEPQFSTLIGSGLEFAAGLPITHVYSPESKIEGEGQGDEEWSLSVGSSLGLFFQTAPWPVELELFFSTPIAGKSSLVSNTVGLQIKNYFSFW